MRTIVREEFKLQKERFFEEIARGAVFIHPTDTIYGIGCDANNARAVRRIRDAKPMYKRPFSVIAPSKEWIRRNCLVTEEAEKWLDKLPGPYTLILNLRNKNCIARETNIDMGTLGVRIPDHWISEIAAITERPIITTSANDAGKNFMTSVEDLDINIKKKMDFIIYEGEKTGRPSILVELTREEMIIER